jgi:hypothetical protein
MRVLGRVLFGALAIVFAMGFLARLIHRRPLRAPRHARLPRLIDVDARERPPALPLLPEAAQTYLAEQPGGRGYLLVPPSSPSRALRRRGRREANRRLTRYSGRALRPSRLQGSGVRKRKGR